MVANTDPVLAYDAGLRLQREMGCSSLHEQQEALLRVALEGDDVSEEMSPQDVSSVTVNPKYLETQTITIHNRAPGTTADTL